jgi:hypothetical protein
MELHAEVLRRITAYPDQEIHLRRLVVDDPRIPDHLDWAMYNVDLGTYTLAMAFPADLTLVEGMIAALEQQREHLA